MHPILYRYFTAVPVKTKSWTENLRRNIASAVNVPRTLANTASQALIFDA